MWVIHCQFSEHRPIHQPWSVRYVRGERTADPPAEKSDCWVWVTGCQSALLQATDCYAKYRCPPRRLALIRQHAARRGRSDKIPPIVGSGRHTNPGAQQIGAYHLLPDVTPCDATVPASGAGVAGIRSCFATLDREFQTPSEFRKVSAGSGSP